jgi:hypothetical protein
LFVTCKPILVPPDIKAIKNLTNACQRTEPLSWGGRVS